MDYMGITCGLYGILWDYMGLYVYVYIYNYYIYIYIIIIYIYVLYEIMCDYIYISDSYGIDFIGFPVSSNLAWKFRQKHESFWGNHHLNISCRLSHLNINHWRCNNLVIRLYMVMRLYNIGVAVCFATVITMRRCNISVHAQGMLRGSQTSMQHHRFKSASQGSTTNRLNCFMFPILEKKNHKGS